MGKYKERRHQRQQHAKLPLENFQKAFASGGKLRPRGRLAMWGYRNFGYALLKVKKPEADKAAVEAFQQAIAHERYAEKKEHPMLFVPRYNLACALARLGKKSDALDALDDSLSMAKDRMPLASLEGFVKQRVLTDEDLESIRDEPRFDEIVKRATGLSTEEVEEEEGL